MININEQTFKVIRVKLPIEDVIGDFIKLSKLNNTYYVGHCPFCKEIFSKALTINPHKQIFYCFGCHKSGDVISFIAIYMNQSQVEAVNTLAKKYNLISEIEAVANQAPPQGQPNE